MTEAELELLTPHLREYAMQEVTMEGVTKFLHEWASERGLTIAKIKDRRVRNSWAESLTSGNLKSKGMRQAWGIKKSKKGK